MKRTKLVLTPLFVLLAAGMFAQPGSLDPEFDGDGIVTTGFETYSAVVSSMLIQPDGKIVLAGSAYKGTGLGNDFALLRYNTDGSLDNSFGIGGKILADFIGNNENTCAIYQQPDGKIIAAGYAYNPGFQNDFAVMRYHPDGNLDNTFDGDGKLLLDFNLTSDFISSIAIQPDDKIVLAGEICVNSSNYITGLVRLNSDGSLDNNFGTGGKVTIGIGPDYSWANSMAIQSDEKILIAGVAGPDTNYNFMLARFNTDGSLDNSFNSSGFVITDLSIFGDVVNSLAIQPDGKIIVAGIILNSGFTSSDFGVARYLPDGILDNSFGNAGKVITKVSEGHGSALSVILQNDGKIVVAGSTDVTMIINNDFALVRYNPNGSLDSQFGNGGIVYTDIGTGNDFASSVALEPDGMIVVAGSTTTNFTDFDFAAARYISTIEDLDVIDFSVLRNSVLICPNPIAENAMLGYTLSGSDKISIRLIDMQGRILRIYLDRKIQEAGRHEQLISLPEEIPAGTYFIQLFSDSGQLSIQILK
jgi:uncharacterized delta-60 repeat protein